MNYNQLLTFLTLAKFKNFTRTAEKLYITQSTVTSRIQNMEKFYNRKLFNREKNIAHLTSFGYEILPLIERQVEIHDTTEQIAKRDFNKYETLKISAPMSILEKMNTEAFNNIYMKEEYLNFEITANHSPDVVQKILDGSIDIGYVYEQPLSKEIYNTIVYKEEIYLYAHKSLQIKQKEISIKDLKKYLFVYINCGVIFQEWYQKTIKDLLNKTFEVSESYLAIKFITNLKGIGFLPVDRVKSSLYEGDLEKITIKDVSFFPTQSIYLIYKKNNHLASYYSKLNQVFN